MTNYKNTLVMALLASALILSACERPPIDTEQVGFRGTGMVLVDNPRDPKAVNDIPAAPAPASAGGPKAGDIYQNVQVLGDLSVGEFTRTMLAMTQWVAPDEGCNYCHNPANLAEEGLYTKTVSRRMLQMTQSLNGDWSAHTGETGVTCYTCHRGKNVPEYIWFESNEAANMQAYLGNRNGQNTPSAAVGYTSMPVDPFSAYLADDGVENIRVATEGWTPTLEQATIQDTEGTYSLMIHLSESLGVNCNFCHNSRSFGSWADSSPQRVTAWHGLRMVSEMNADYLIPLHPVYPENRLGENGDAPKANCSTCHQGQNKPLGGVNMVDGFPALQ